VLLTETAPAARNALVTGNCSVMDFFSGLNPFRQNFQIKLREFWSIADKRSQLFLEIDYFFRLKLDNFAVGF
jgi:hypothetical protein